MRGGTYGWLAAEAGVFVLCFTNTMPNLPPWGATNPAIGNNPLILAIPRREGPIVLDMAISQFSYGTLAAYSKRGEPLPVAAGFNAQGALTTDAAVIEQSQSALPPPNPAIPPATLVNRPSACAKRTCALVSRSPPKSGISSSGRHLPLCNLLPLTPSKQQRFWNHAKVKSNSCFAFRGDSVGALVFSERDLSPPRNSQLY